MTEFAFMAFPFVVGAVAYGLAMAIVAIADWMEAR